MFRKRLITAFTLIPPVILMTWAGGVWFNLLALVWGLMPLSEFYQLVARSKVKPFTTFGLLWSILLILSPLVRLDFALPLILTGAVVIPLVSLLFCPRKEDAFSRWVWTLAGMIYVGWLLSYLVALRGAYPPLAIDKTMGRNWVFYVIIAVSISDSFAYLTGITLGRHHLAPYVSPAKTWEGAIGGIGGAVIVSLLFKLPTPLALPLTYPEAIVLGITVSVFGQLGDLVKSLLKRNTGVKDSSNLLPGHGGFLDRVDSVLFAGVLVYYYVLFMA
ncbi:MAG: phosphatidate cytidylyltransferase [Chloroflexota bacterium]